MKTSLNNPAKYDEARTRVIDSLSQNNSKGIDTALTDFKKILKTEKMRQNEKELLSLAEAQKDRLNNDCKKVFYYLLEIVKFRLLLIIHLLHINWSPLLRPYSHIVSWSTYQMNEPNE